MAEELLNTLALEAQEVLEHLFQVLVLMQAQNQLQFNLIQLQLVGVALDKLLVPIQVGLEHQVLILFGVQLLEVVVAAVEVLLVLVVVDTQVLVVDQAVVVHLLVDLVLVLPQ